MVHDSRFLIKVIDFNVTRRNCCRPTGRDPYVSWKKKLQERQQKKRNKLRKKLYKKKKKINTKKTQHITIVCERNRLCQPLALDLSTPCGYCTHLGDLCFPFPFVRSSLQLDVPFQYLLKPAKHIFSYFLFIFSFRGPPLTLFFKYDHTTIPGWDENINLFSIKHQGISKEKLFHHRFLLIGWIPSCTSWIEWREKFVLQLLPWTRSMTQTSAARTAAVMFGRMDVISLIRSINGTKQ